MILTREVWEQARVTPLDRGPDGRSLKRFRWAVIEGVVVVFPQHSRSSTEAPSAIATGAWEMGVPRRSRAFAFWVAQAARQELWRRQRRRPGFLPVTAVRAAGDIVEIDAVGIKAGPVPPLPDMLFADAQRWFDWARQKAG